MESGPGARAAFRPTVSEGKGASTVKPYLGGEFGVSIVSAVVPALAHSGRVLASSLYGSYVFSSGTDVIPVT